MTAIMKRLPTPDHGNVVDPVAADVVGAARLLAAQYPHGGCAGLAAATGIPSLAKKLDPHQDTHHLRLDESVLLQQAAKRHDILHAMADVLGFVCTPKGADRDGSLLDRIMGLSSEFGDVMHTVRDAVSDGVVTPNELQRIEREAGELQAALEAVLKTVRGL